MRAWFGSPLPRLTSAEAYRPLMEEHLVKLEGRRREVDRTLEALRPPETALEDFLRMPPAQEEATLIAERDTLETALARVRFFVEGEEQEWAVRYGPGADDALELVPLSVAGPAAELLLECGEVVLLSSAFLGHRAVVAEHLGLAEGDVRAFRSASPFALEQRPIVYRPVGRLSRATLPGLEPALFTEVASILDRHTADKGLIHAASYAAARRLVAGLAERAPRHVPRLIFVDSSQAKLRALELHRASAAPTVLVSPSLREGVDLPDDFLRFQIITKMPYPDLGDPWTAARRARDQRWYALETAKALVQAYGRSCRNAEDHGATYILDAQFEGFVQYYRALLPEWFLDAAEPALRAQRRGAHPAQEDELD
jgi:Rad3-related DNA helicase